MKINPQKIYQASFWLMTALIFVIGAYSAYFIYKKVYLVSLDIDNIIYLKNIVYSESFSFGQLDKATEKISQKVNSPEGEDKNIFSLQ